MRDWVEVFYALNVNLLRKKETVQYFLNAFYTKTRLSNWYETT